jgi:hypothetical protein
MRMTQATRQLSSADFVDGECEARMDLGIELLPMLCVAVWGYMYGEAALTQCADASSGRLESSYALPYGMVALGCALLEINATGFMRMPPVDPNFAAQWFPGFALRPGSASASAVRSLPLRTLRRGSHIAYAMDGITEGECCWFHGL